MYQNFFGLRALPFGTSPDPRFLCMLPQTREALACLQYGIANRNGFVVVTGEVGTGKTTILKTVLSTFARDRVASAFIFNPQLEYLDFLELMFADFGIEPETRTKSGMLLQLTRWLVERYRKGILCVLAVDEAQNLSWALLEEIRLLTNLETSSGKLLQIVLSGQPELEETLRQPNLRQLRQRVSIWCRTTPLTKDQTQTYISERLWIAGARESLFTPEAAELVHAYSNGIPRIINRICEHALIEAYVEQIKPIPASIVESVGVELSLDNSGVLSSVSAPETSAEQNLSKAVSGEVFSTSHSPASISETKQ